MTENTHYANPFLTHSPLFLSFYLPRRDRFREDYGYRDVPPDRDRRDPYRRHRDYSPPPPPHPLSFPPPLPPPGYRYAEQWCTATNCCFFFLLPVIGIHMIGLLLLTYLTSLLRFLLPFTIDHTPQTILPHHLATGMLNNGVLLPTVAFFFSYQ